MVKHVRGSFKRRSIVSLLIIIVSFLSFPVLPCQAEVFKLVDGTQLMGDLVHYYNGTFEIATKEGMITLPKDKVLSISFEKKQVSSEFATPEDTFKTWLKAIKENDIEKMTQCYGLVYQNIFAMQMKELGKKERQEVFEIFLSDSLQITGNEKKDDSYMLKLEFEEEGKTETVWLKFLNEAGEWKMYPP